MSTDAAPRFVRLQVDVVVEIADRGALGAAALDQVSGDTSMPEEERERAVRSVRADDTEALAYLVDPYDLVSGVPGVELARASWSCGPSGYDPSAEDWEPEDEDGDFGPEHMEDLEGIDEKGERG